MATKPLRPRMFKALDLSSSWHCSETSVKFLLKTLPTIAENLALDEALLVAADEGPAGEEVLRLWQTTSTFVVLGRSSKVDVEVDREAAERLDAPIFRRVSGGTSIAASRGCLFYAVLLNLEQRPHLRMLDEAHRYVMSRTLAGVEPLCPDIRFQGTCDLVLGDRKVSGNSLRVGRNWLVYHGTLLVDMNLQLIAQLLNHPPREPDYRAGRKHEDFLANLRVDTDRLIHSLRAAWAAEQALEAIPTEIVGRLVSERYSRAEWNYQR